MRYIFNSHLGEQLYHLLPEVYRSRDKKNYPASVMESGDGDLARYLDAHGNLLDLIHATLEQQLKDTLPESSQDWLLPYFAQLLAVDLLSPDSEGKHAEVSNAVSWRQRKGTLKCSEEIAEAIGQMEVEIQEGWKRVAITPHIGAATAWDNSLALDKKVPADTARHPALPAAMVDLRRPSRAVEADPENPATRYSKFAGVKRYWCQLNPHGVPCGPGGFDDVSRRTVDFRTPDAHKGHFHPKHVLAYAAPANGMFPFTTLAVTWPEALDDDLIEAKQENGVLYYINKTDRVIEITDLKVTFTGMPHRFERINFQHELEITAGATLKIANCEIKRLSIDNEIKNEFVLKAHDCLFEELSTNGKIQLDSCTVLETAWISELDAKDCLFSIIVGENLNGSIAYSRIPEDAIEKFDKDKMAIKSHVEIEEEYIPLTDTPEFFPGQNTLAARAMLFPATVDSLTSGASDNGEVGYFHYGRKGRPVSINGDDLGNLLLTLPEDGGYALYDVVFKAHVTIDSGKLILVRGAAKTLTIYTAFATGEADAALDAKDCVFDSVNVPNALARFEYCTIMDETYCKQLQASDCIFVDSVTVTEEDPRKAGCIRYSTIPRDFDNHKLSARNEYSDTNTRLMPIFNDYIYCENNADTYRKPLFGEPGYAVLNIATPKEIQFGAEDGGEMGAYHNRYYSLKVEAVLDKMKDFLPVGIEPILIFDSRLLHEPVEIDK